MARGGLPPLFARGLEPEGRREGADSAMRLGALSPLSAACPAAALPMARNRMGVSLAADRKRDLHARVSTSGLGHHDQSHHGV
eukprot:15435458-Alexandrium_andersonii.AAC.1